MIRALNCDMQKGKPVMAGAAAADHLWSERDDIRARRQGWFIEHGCTGSRIRALRHLFFSTDAMAVAYVAGRAVMGDALARSAIRFLAAEHGLDKLSLGVPPVDVSALFIGRQEWQNANAPERARPV